MCVCVDCACPTGDWPPCDRPALTEPARVPLLARCRTGAAAAGHLHLHALLPWNALVVLPRRLDKPWGESFFSSQRRGRRRTMITMTRSDVVLRVGVARRRQS